LNGESDDGGLLEFEEFFPSRALNSSFSFSTAANRACRARTSAISSSTLVGIQKTYPLTSQRSRPPDAILEIRRRYEAEPLPAA
jgi:hypothetical protein